VKHVITFDSTRSEDRLVLRLVTHAENLRAFQSEWRKLLARVYQGKDEEAQRSRAEVYLFQTFHKMWKESCLDFVFEED
jgi:hypothetical protein